MKVLIANLIIYTNENRTIKKVNTIKDTMIYDLCLAFVNKGIDVTLAASDAYKPITDEEYPFKVEWLKTKLTGVLSPHNMPYCPDIKKLAKYGEYDLIITSDVFSLNSLMLAIHNSNNLIVWQELAKHNKMLKGYASRFWYGIIARLFFQKATIVPRSVDAKEFISQYCKKVSNTIIDHGVNLNKFKLNTNKSNTFAVSSQLIERKHIEKTIDAFAKYLKKYDNTAELIIMGDGDKRKSLENQVKELKIENNVRFTGQLSHDKLIDVLSDAKAMLVYTEKDNNMISIVESIAVGTPVITTTVPYNARYIKSESLGIVSDNWNEDDLHEAATNQQYISNCVKYRNIISTDYKVSQFLTIK